MSYPYSQTDVLSPNEMVVREPRQTAVVSPPVRVLDVVTFERLLETAVYDYQKHLIAIDAHVPAGISWADPLPHNVVFSAVTDVSVYDELTDGFAIHGLRIFTHDCLTGQQETAVSWGTLAEVS